MPHVRGKCYRSLLIVLILVVLNTIYLARNVLAQSNCGEVQKMARSSPNADKPIEVSMMELRNNAPNYYGKTVTVDGELHRTFTDKVFTIEGGDWANGFDVLVISTVSNAQSVTPLKGSLGNANDVRVTGVVEPYDRDKLECAYGPLRLESHQGHSFTKSPVLVIDRGTAGTEGEKSTPETPAAPHHKP